MIFNELYKEMLDEILNAARNLTPSLIVAVVTAIITVKLSIKRFRTERWWERKADVYSRIVESLYHVKVYCDVMISKSLETVHYSPDHLENLSNNYTTAYRDLQKASHIGAYIICDEAAKVLDELQKRQQPEWQTTPPWEFYEIEAKAFGCALDKIRKIAKKDLGVI